MSEYINRLADNNIMKAIFNYLMEDIGSRYMGSTKRLGEWYKGIGSTDGNIYITLSSSENGILYRTGTDDDNWFYLTFIVCVKRGDSYFVSGASSKERLSDRDHSTLECYVAENLADYVEEINGAIKYYYTNQNREISKEDIDALEAQYSKYKHQLDAAVVEYQDKCMRKSEEIAAEQEKLKLEKRIRDENRGYSDDEAREMAGIIQKDLIIYAKNQNYIEEVYVEFSFIEKVDFAVFCGIVTTTKIIHRNKVKNHVNNIMSSHMKEGMYINIVILNNSKKIKKKYNLDTPVYKK